LIVDDLKIELVTEGLSFPTSISFVDDDKILVLEKNTGLVRLISGWSIAGKPVLRLPVDIKAERGLLGIAVLHNGNNNNNGMNNDSYNHIGNKLDTGPRSSANTTNVFLYFTESNNKSNNIVND
jgi:glucose/arabinose dehydrogenase